MTPEQVQRYEANSPAAMQAQQIKGQQAMQQQKFQQDQVLEDQKTLGKAGAEALRAATEHSLSMEEQGQPSNNPESFGSETSL